MLVSGAFSLTLQFIWYRKYESHPVPLQLLCSPCPFFWPYSVIKVDTYWVLTHSRSLPSTVSDGSWHVYWHSSLTLNYIFPLGTVQLPMPFCPFSFTQSLSGLPGPCSSSSVVSLQFVPHCCISPYILMFPYLNMPLSCFMHDVLP